jgi:CRP-like cAMP-binding protein
MGNMHSVSGCVSQAQLTGEFFNKLSPAALRDLSSMAYPLTYSAGIILFSEKDPTPGVYVVMEGEVKLSINSSDGKRLILRIAKKGEILGLASTLSGTASEMTAETLYPSRIAPIERREFLSFLTRHTEAYQNVTATMPRHASSCAPWDSPLPLRRNLPGCCLSGARTARRQRTARDSFFRSPMKR